MNIVVVGLCCDGVGEVSFRHMLQSQFIFHGQCPRNGHFHHILLQPSCIIFNLIMLIYEATEESEYSLWVIHVWEDIKRLVQMDRECHCGSFFEMDVDFIFTSFGKV